MVIRCSRWGVELELGSWKVEVWYCTVCRVIIHAISYESSYMYATFEWHRIMVEGK